MMLARTEDASPNAGPSGDVGLDSPVIQRHETAAVTMRLERMSKRARLLGTEVLPGRSNYLVGREPARWRTGIPTYARVSYKGVYRGIEMAFYGKGGQLEYDFIVAPGANPRAIAIRFSGIEAQSIDANGNLVLNTAVGQITQHKPIAYQADGRGKRDVECSFVIGTRGEIRFRLGKYDTSEPLTIDPQISYSGVIGGGADDIPSSIAVDSSGSIYVSGSTYYAGFPTVGGINSPPSGQDAFVFKLDPTGSTLTYSTLIGGSGSDQSNGIAVDSRGNAYLTGSTDSQDFPTVNAVQPQIEGSTDAFVAKLNPSGSALVYSTYLGGKSDDFGNSIAVDGAGAAYIAGETFFQGFPVVKALQPTNNSPSANCFVTKLDANGGIVYSTYLGGSGGDYATAIAVDSQGNAYVTGSATSLDFPLQNPQQSTFQAHSLLKSSDAASSWVGLDTAAARNSSVFNIAVDPHDARNVYIATTKGVFKSSDRGVSWTAANNGLTEAFANTIAIDPVNSTTIYTAIPDGVFKSTDAGDSWHPVATSLAGANDSSIAIDPLNPSQIYVGNFYGIFRTTDGGITWSQTPINFFITGVNRIIADPKTTGTVYAALKPNKVVKSTDGGGFWTTIFNGMDIAYNVDTVELDPITPTTLYVGTDGGFVYKSTDGGKSFPFRVQPAGSFSPYVTAILVDPATPSTVYTSLFGGTVYKSSDGGASWVAGSTGLVGAYVNAIVAGPGGAGVLYLGTYPVTHAFVATLDAAGANLTYSTYIGGEASDGTLGIAVDASFNCYITGSTTSKAFPLSNALQPTLNGYSNAFACKIGPSGSNLIYSTYFGGDGVDTGRAIAVDPFGNATIAGQATSDNLSVVSPFQPTLLGSSNGFVAQLGPTGGLIYSTYLGGTTFDLIYAVAVDSSGNSYVTGLTNSADFPLTPGAVDTSPRTAGSVFVTKVRNEVSQLAVTAARIDGKNGLIYGQNFGAGAVLLVNGQQARARNDDQQPATLLFAKKLGRQIAPGQTVTLQVRNPDGTLSNILNFTRPAN